MGVLQIIIPIAVVIFIQCVYPESVPDRREAMIHTLNFTVQCRGMILSGWIIDSKVVGNLFGTGIVHTRNVTILTDSPYNLWNDGQNHQLVYSADCADYSATFDCGEIEDILKGQWFCSIDTSTGLMITDMEEFSRRLYGRQACIPDPITGDTATYGVHLNELKYRSHQHQLFLESVMTKCTDQKSAWSS